METHLDAAPRAPLPDEFRAELASLAQSAPVGEAWLHEVKYDGYRIGCRLEQGRVKLLTRHGNDWTDRLPRLVEAARALPVSQALLDGELAVLMPDGRTSFQALQNLLSGEAGGELAYFAFDLLHLDGRDTAALALEERKGLLEQLLARLPAGSLLRYSGHWVGNGPLVHGEACRLGFEGIVSKRRDRPYRPGRHADWVKTKCTRRQELVIGGFTDPKGRRHGLGALLVGHHDAVGELRFAGKVGTGFTERSAGELRRRLEALEQSEPPFSPRPAGWLGGHAHWVRPELVAEVDFAEWTRDGRVRHASFQGLREDKRPEEVVGEALPEAAPPPPHPATPLRRARETGNEVAGVVISHPQRVVFPELGLTKLALARYYERVSDRMLPHLEGRPLTLVQCPEGVGADCFYVKHTRSWAPGDLRRVQIREKHKVGEYLVVDSPKALVSLVQMGIVELHTWNSRAGAEETPDRIVIDLDPGPRVSWTQVIDAARLVRAAFAALDLQAFVKNTGGSGLHVVVPLVPERDWRDLFALARRLSEILVEQSPESFTTSVRKRGRERKILLDYLRNNRTNTSVAAYSVRARPRAPVSTPLSWDELDPTVPADHFTVENLERRLARLAADPWRDYARVRQRLEAQTLKGLGLG